MRQLSLFESTTLAGLIPAIKAAMRHAAKMDEKGRKLLVERLNNLAAHSDVRLTAGNKPEIDKTTLDKWLSRSDREHTPSILALAAMCIATGDHGPLQELARVCGCEVISKEEKAILEYGKAVLEEEAARKRKRRIKENLQ